MKSRTMIAKDYLTINGVDYVRLDKCHECIQNEINKKINALYDEIGRDIIAQVSAVYLSVLHKEFGFGTDRLNKVYDGVTSLFKIMGDKTINASFTPDDCINYVKNNFGIDVYNIIQRV